MTAAGGDIHELRSLSEKIGQLEARREAIVTENSRKHANLGTYEMTDPTEVLEKSAEDFAAQVHESSIALAPRYRLVFRHSFIPFFSVDTQVSSLKRLLEGASGNPGPRAGDRNSPSAARRSLNRHQARRGVRRAAAATERAETLLDLSPGILFFFHFIFSCVFTFSSVARYLTWDPHRGN